MKFTPTQNRKISSVYSDLNSIEHSNDLNRLKFSLNDFRTCQDVFEEIRYNGKSETFNKSVADYFKKFGFTVNLKGVNFIIAV